MMNCTAHNPSLRVDMNEQPVSILFQDGSESSMTTIYPKGVRLIEYLREGITWLTIRNQSGTVSFLNVDNVIAVTPLEKE